MNRSAVILGIVIGLGAAIVATWDVDVSVGPSVAVADSHAEPAFWVDGKGGIGAPGGRPSSFADLAEQLSPAVVSIEIPRAPSERDRMFAAAAASRRSPRARAS